MWTPAEATQSNGLRCRCVEILQHGFRKHLVQRLRFWRGKNDVRIFARRLIRVCNEQNVLVLHVYLPQFLWAHRIDKSPNSTGQIEAPF